MSSIHVDAVVRLKEDVPAQGLCRGDRGVVLGVWLSPEGFFCEVDFPKLSRAPAVRALLRTEQLEAVDSQPPTVNQE